jgi:hypothetical protein
MLNQLGHVLAENRNGLVARVQVRMASGSSEREAALEMLLEAWTGRRRVGWSRQRIRRAGVCGRYARSEGGAARGAKRTPTGGAPSMCARRGSWVMR